MDMVSEALLALGGDRGRIERKIRHSSQTDMVRAFLDKADIERIEHTSVQESVFRALLDVVMHFRESDDTRPLIATAVRKLEHLFGRSLDGADVEEMARLAFGERLPLPQIQERFRIRSVPLM